MTSINPFINALHDTYCVHSRMQITLDYWREECWAQYLAHKFTQADLIMVIAHIRHGIKSGARNPGALKFSNLIGQLDRFEEDLAEARAYGRKRVAQPDKVAVLKMTGRDEPVPLTRHVSEILKALPELNRQ